MLPAYKTIEEANIRMRELLQEAEARQLAARALEARTFKAQKSGQSPNKFLHWIKPRHDNIVTDVQRESRRVSIVVKGNQS